MRSLFDRLIMLAVLAGALAVAAIAHRFLWAMAEYADTLGV